MSNRHMKTLTFINKQAKTLNSGQISIFVSQESKDTHTHTHPHTQYWNVSIHKLWWTARPFCGVICQCVSRAVKYSWLLDLSNTHLEMYPKEIIKDAVRDLCSVLFIITKNWNRLNIQYSKNSWINYCTPISSLVMQPLKSFEEYVVSWRHIW